MREFALLPIFPFLVHFSCGFSADSAMQWVVEGTFDRSGKIEREKKDFARAC